MENKIYVSNHQPVYIYIRWRIKVPGGFPGGFHAGFVVNFHGDKKWLNFWDLSWDLLGYLWLIYG